MNSNDNVSVMHNLEMLMSLQLERGRFTFMLVFVGPGSMVISGDITTSCTLPLEVYKTFDRDGKGSVPVLELFMALALYSDGHIKDRMAFCFMYVCT